MNQRGTFLPGKAVRVLVTFTLPPPTEPTQPALKALLFKKKILARMRRVILTWESLRERGR